MSLLRTLVIKVERYLRNYPVVLFQSCALLFLFDVTDNGWLGLFGAIGCGRALRRWLIGRFNLQARRGVLRFMDQYRGCSFHPVEIDDVMGPGFAAFLINRSMSTNRTRADDSKSADSPWLQTALAARAHALRVFVVEPQPGADFPTAPTAFPLVIGGYVFLLDSQPAAQELQAAVRASSLETGGLTAEQQDRIAAAVADKAGASDSGPRAQSQGSESDA